MTTPRTPQQTVAYQLEGRLVAGKQYPAPLPADVLPWYAYTRDGGHSIVCALAQHYQPDTDLTDELVPVPVKTVLRGYTVRGGYVVVDAAYRPDVGLVTPPEDDEF